MLKRLFLCLAITCIYCSNCNSTSIINFNSRLTKYSDAKIYKNASQCLDEILEEYFENGEKKNFNKWYEKLCPINDLYYKNDLQNLNKSVLDSFFRTLRQAIGYHTGNHDTYVISNLKTLIEYFIEKQENFFEFFLNTKFHATIYDFLIKI